MKQKEFNVDDFVAEEGAGFLVEVKDTKGNLVDSVQLKVTIDAQEEQTIDSESDGTFKITPQPQNTLKISEVIGN